MKTVKAFFLKQWDRVRNSSFIKSIFTLSAGVVISQSVALLTTPIISRIYTPEVLGDFSLITSNATILGVFVCLGLLTAIMIPKEDDESKGLCRLITLSIIGISTILLIVALAVSGKWRIFSVDLDYRIACIILWIYVILTNIVNVVYAYVNRQKMYKVLFWNPTIGTVTNATVSIVLGLLGCGLWGYTCGNLLAMGFTIVHMLRYVNPFKGKLDSKYSAMRMLKKHKDFPLYQLPANFVGTISQQLPIQLINKYFGSAILGAYSMCLTILGIPSRFLSAPVNRVYYQEASHRYNSGEEIGEFSYKILETNIRIAIVPISILIVFGRPLFTFVLGEQWTQAGNFAAILGIYQLVLFCSSCLSGGFVIIGKQRINLFLSIINIVVNIFSFVIGNYMFKDIFKVLAIYSLMGTASNLFSNGLFFVKTGVNIAKYLRFVLFYIVFPTLASLALRWFLVWMEVL